MTGTYHHYSGLLFDGKHSVQLNFQGHDQTGVEAFEKACVSHGARWAQLMNLRTGKIAASYSLQAGLEQVADESIPGASIAAAMDNFHTDEWQGAELAGAVTKAVREMHFSTQQHAILTAKLQEVGVKLGPRSPAASPGGMG